MYNKQNQSGIIIEASAYFWFFFFLLWGTDAHVDKDVKLKICFQVIKTIFSIFAQCFKYLLNK